MTKDTQQRAAIERAVEEAMESAWTEICSDTNCCPLDITRHRGRTYFEPRHWSALTAKWAADAILAAQPAPVSEGGRLRAFVEKIAGASSRPSAGEPNTKYLARVIREQRRDARNLLDTLPADPVACADGVNARLLTTAKLLYANAVGCAQIHYGEDYNLHGMPGWLSDCRADIEAAEAIAALSPSSPGGGE